MFEKEAPPVDAAVLIALITITIGFLMAVDLWITRPPKPPDPPPCHPPDTTTPPHVACTGRNTGQGLTTQDDPKIDTPTD